MTLAECPIDLWVVYENPDDFPGRFVVRRHTIAGGESSPCEDPACVVGGLEAARASIPFDCLNLGRHPDDEPQIVEVWL